MISVTNRNTWENYFNQISIKNCDVKIYDNLGTLLLNKSNISSFRLTSRNSYVCETIPTDDCQIEILDWFNLSSTIRNYLSTEKNMIKMSFVVEEDETTKCKVLCVKSCEYSEKTKRATLYLTSVFSLMFSSSKIDVTRTWAERIQLQAIAQAKCLKIPNVDYNLAVSISYDPYGLDVGTLSCGISSFTSANADRGNYAINNVYNYEITTVEDKSDLTIYGRESGTGTVAYIDSQAYFIVPIFSTTNEYVFDRIDVYQKQTEISNWSYVGTNNASTFDDKGLTGFMTTLKNITTTQPITKVDVYGYALQMSEIPANIKTHYLQTPYLETGSQELTNIQTALRNYYSLIDCYQYEGRIDPTIEPLDLIFVNNIGIFVEEVTINFNGGFTGTVKGRYSNAPVLENLDIDNGTFDIKNITDSNKTLVIVYSGGLLSFTINANSTKSFDVFGSGSESALINDWQDYSEGRLASDVYCVFGTSPRVIILDS